MCGIVGYVGPRPVRPLLLSGLEHLEYRGYDSAGISVLDGPRIDAVRAVGNLRALRDAIELRRQAGEGGVAVAERESDEQQVQTDGSEAGLQTGIGHTRWATHGRVSEANAHPHFDTADRIHIVVNGIVENYVELKQRLEDMGAVFTSETDAEVIAHLIAYHGARGSLVEAVREQDDAISDTMGERVVREVSVDLGDLGKVDDSFLLRVRRIVIVACGTAYHAGLVGRYAIEEWARVPVEVEIASEYRYRNPVVGPNDLVIGISQSGETADTLAAMRAGRERGATVLAVTNIMGSQATREADGVFYTRAGLEIGVAATKTFVAQVIAMYLLGLRLAELRGTLEPAELSRLVADLKGIPSAIEHTIESVEGDVQGLARAHAENRFFLYL